MWSRRSSRRAGGARLGGVGLILLAILGCQRAASRDEGLHVIVSIYPLYDFTRQVVGDRGRVTLLVPPGIEPHDWEPAPADVVQVRAARLVVYNGAGIDPWTEKLLGEMRTRGSRSVRATDGLDLLTTEGRPDPHVWLDPLMARLQVEAIRSALTGLDAEHAAVYDANAAALSGHLLALHERFARGLERCARREIIVSHAAFAYLARRYHLTQLPVIASLAPDAEPSPAALGTLARQARRAGVTHVFFERLVAARLADTLAREIGAATLVLDPIEGLTREMDARGATYLELMQANLENLRTGLSCQ